MSPKADKQTLKARFIRNRSLAQAPVRLAIERRVCGCDYGGTSWTTAHEAKQVAELLQLGRGKRLLDVGAGSGWPGLYLGAETGCDVVLTDMPEIGLQIAAARAEADANSGDCWVAAADGAALPFVNSSFDAVSHSDVLCCLTSKQGVLDSCRRVTRTGGRMAFTVISIASNLSAANHERADAAAPPFAGIEASYPDMLEQAGWDVTSHIDLTADFLELTRLMVSEEKSHAVELRDLHGEAGFTARFTKHGLRIQALEEGLLRRELFAATAA